MAKPTSRLRKRTTLALVALFTISGAGVAFAYWTSTGTGTGSATTGTSVEFTIASQDAVGEIAPGSAGQTVDFTVTNPGPGAQSLSGMVVTLADATGAPWVPAAGCNIADYTATITTAPVYGEIAANDSVSGTATVKLRNTAANQDACQDEVVPLYFAAS